MDTGITLSQADGRPMYLQIMEQIKRRIAIGDWPPGSTIPSIRALAASLRISVITVKRAYSELEREGVIVTQHGKGSCVADSPALRDRLGERDLEHLLEKVLALAEAHSISPEVLARHLLKAQKKEDGYE